MCEWFSLKTNEQDGKCLWIPSFLSKPNLSEQIHTGSIVKSKSHSLAWFSQRLVTIKTKTKENHSLSILLVLYVGRSLTLGSMGNSTRILPKLMIRTRRHRFEKTSQNLFARSPKKIPCTFCKKTGQEIPLDLFSKQITQSVPLHASFLRTLVNSFRSKFELLLFCFLTQWLSAI